MKPVWVSQWDHVTKKKKYSNLDIVYQVSSVLFFLVTDKMFFFFFISKINFLNVASSSNKSISWGFQQIGNSNAWEQDTEQS